MNLVLYYLQTFTIKQKANKKLKLKAVIKLIFIEFFIINCFSLIGFLLLTSKSLIFDLMC